MNVGLYQITVVRVALHKMTLHNNSFSSVLFRDTFSAAEVEREDPALENNRSKRLHWVGKF
jgi:hypothetical protein